MTAPVILWAMVALLMIHYFGWLKLPAEEEEGKTSLLLVFGAFFLFFSLQLFVFPLIYFSIYGRGPEGNSLDIYNMIAISQSVVILLGYARFVGKNHWNSIWGVKSWKGNIKTGALCWGLVFPFVMIVSSCITSVLGSILDQSLEDYNQTAVQYLERLVNQPWLFIPMAVVFAGFVPIGEELLFRGFLYNWMKRVIRRSWAIFFTAFLFALVHFSAGQGIANLIILPSLFVLSWTLTFLYERTGSLWAPIGLHMVFNLISILMLWTEKGVK